MVDNNNSLVPAIDWATLEKVVVEGDIAALSPAERLNYYRTVCDSVGLNPATQPFAYIKLNGKLTLYARKDATDQLRRRYHVSIAKLEKERDGDLFTVTAYATTPDGRQDADMGAVSIKNLQGEQLANAYLKAITKAKRRVTLSICGLGMLDETEVDSIPNAEQFDANDHQPPLQQQRQPSPTQAPTPPTKPVIEVTAHADTRLNAYQQRRIYELRDKLGEDTAWINKNTKALYKADSSEVLTDRDAEDFIARLEARHKKQEAEKQQHADDELAEIPF